MADHERPESAPVKTAAQRRLRRGVFVVPSLLTTGNIFCGFYSVTESLLGAQALSLGDVGIATEHFDRAAINIGFAYLFDALDGRIARMTGSATDFGVELDSIADVLSFGIAPALLAFSWGYGAIPQLHKIGWAVSFLFLICGALRLARFNVQARHPNPKQFPNPKTEKKAFVGLPIPAGATLIAAIVHFWPSPLYQGARLSIPSLGNIDGTMLGIGMIALVTCLAFLMVSTLRYSSFKGAGARKYHPRVLFLAIALIGLSIWFYSRWSLLMMASLYASSGILAKLSSLIRPRKAKAERETARTEPVRE
jgi:CDP-diacylglycerol--serine O-phosphatidyltransferase